MKTRTARVTELMAGGDLEGVTHSESTWVTGNGVTLYSQAWTSAPANALLVLVHGGGEHSGRYDETARRLVREGVAVHAFDLRGHGKSPGVRGHVRRFTDYVEDVAAFIRQVSQGASDSVPILLGHSLGGLISAFYAIEHPQTIRCLVLSSPLWGLNIPVPLWKHLLAYGLASLWPSLTMRRPKHGADVLSHDPQVAKRYAGDPLVHLKASARFYVELRRKFQELPGALPRLRVPVLVLQAGDDQIASTEATERLFPLIGSGEKRLLVYDGYYHELFNEVERERVFRDLVEWLRAHRFLRSP